MSTENQGLLAGWRASLTSLLLGSSSKPTSAPEHGGLRTRATKVALVLVLLASTVVSYFAVSMVRQQARPQLLGNAPDSPFAPPSGSYLVAYVVTAANCGWSNEPAMKDLFKAIRPMLKATHRDAYAQVTVVGIALDEDLDVGLRFLSQLGNGTPNGAFDQIVVGGRWLNEEIVRFVWRDAVAQAASPVVILVERPVDAESYKVNYQISVKEDKVISIKVGANEIKKWINDGTPLETSPRAARSSGIPQIAFR